MLTILEFLMNTPSDDSISSALIIDRIIYICLFFLFAIIPLIINPFAFDYYYKPKIDSVYALIIIIVVNLTIRHVFLKRPLRFRNIPLTIPLIAYGISAILSTLFSISPKLSIFGDIWRLESVFTLLSYVILVFLFSNLVETEKQFQQLMKGLFISASLVALYAIIQYSGYNPTEHFIPLFRHNRINSTIGNTNFLGKFLVLVIPLYMAYYLIATNRAEKCFLGAGILLTICTLFLTFTRASWFGFCIACILFTWLAGGDIIWKKKKRIIALMLIALGFSICIVLYASAKGENPQGQRIFVVKDRIFSSFDIKEGRGVATRLFVWRKVIGLIQERPFIGFGPDTHVLPMSTFNLEYIRKFNDRVIIDRAHNNYLDITVAQGLIGLATYLLIIIIYLIWLGQTIKHEKNASHRILFGGILSSFVGYLINDIFIFSVVSVSPTFWSLMGITFAFKRIICSQDNQ